MVEERLGYRFRDPELPVMALTHPSAVPESTTSGSPLSYQRLEFLGDAVIELVVREALLREYPEEDEGRLTRRKIEVVSSENLQRRAMDLGIAALLETGPSLDDRHLEAAGSTVLADVLEALVGAVYLDGGLEAVREVLQERILGPCFLSESSSDPDPKSRLQELCQERYGMRPRYEITGKDGPDHRPTYVARVYLGDRPLGRGRGPTKKTAHRDAASSALEMLEDGEDE